MTTTPELLEVCYSCVAAAENGVDSIEGEDVDAWRERYLAAVDHFGAEPIMLWTFDDDGEPFFFSKASCDYCGDTLAGHRCEAILNTNN